MDDLRERLGRLAARVDERTEPFRWLERRRAGRARARKAGTAVLALAVGAAATFGVVRAFDEPEPLLAPHTDGLPSPTQAYEHALGWSIDVPSDWTVLPIDASNGETNLVGAAFSDGPLVAAEVERRVSPWSVIVRSRLEPEQGVLVVIHTDPGWPPRVADDSSFPLTPREALILNANPPYDRALPFRGDGLAFGAWYGPTTRDAQRHVMEDMVRSIRFEPWDIGEVRNGLRSLGLASSFRQQGDVSYAGRLQTVFVLRDGDAFFALDVPNFGCEGPAWVQEGSSGLITTTEAACPEDLWYDLEGNPDPRNPPDYQTTLERYPLIRAHDGSLLLDVNSS